MHHTKSLSRVSRLWKGIPAELSRQPRPARSSRAAAERTVHGLFFLCGFLAVASVLFISVYLVASGRSEERRVGKECRL